MDFKFFMPVRVYSGKNAVFDNKNVFSTYGKKCGIVTGRTSAEKSGALKDVIAVFNETEIEYTVYNGITENPLITACREAGTQFENEKVDFVLGIGGGSVLDAAKAVAIYASNPSLSAEDIYLRKYENEALPVLLIGTSSGTGSEVSGVSVLTNPATGRKKSISGPDCYARAVFADSRYTESMPYDVTVSTALDALSHAVEGFFTSKCTDIPTLFAYKAIPMLWECLKNIDNGKEIDSDMHEKLYFGSLYAGMVLNPCGTVFPHPLGYVLTENYGIPHGKACTAFMTELIDRGFAYEGEKAQRLMEMMKTERGEFCGIVKRLTALREITMTREEIENYCSRWDSVLPGNFLFSPGGFTREDAEEIFLKKFLK